jgi:putative nucleotidyltransferase with HDIG domain
MLVPAHDPRYRMKKLSPANHEFVLKRIRDIPSLPEVVNKIIQLLSQPNTPASEIAQLIAYDPGLTSRVLRMVNSAAYGFNRQISSIQHGIMILGFNTVRGLVLSASIFKLLGQSGTDSRLNHQKFWEHSLATASAARSLAKFLRIPEAEEAFSGGMLHDIGKVVLDVYFMESYRQVVETAAKKGISMHGEEYLALERELLGTTHAELGALLTAKWKLPITITEVIQYHHQPNLATLAPQMVHLIALANEATRLYFEQRGEFTYEDFSPELLAFFELKPEDIEPMQAFLEPEYLTVAELLHSLANP